MVPAHRTKIHLDIPPAARKGPARLHPSPRQCAPPPPPQKMSKLTLGVIAAASAATGAACTALYYSAASRKVTPSVPSTTAPAPSKLPKPGQTQTQTQSPVDPAGLFQYGEWKYVPVHDMQSRSAPAGGRDSDTLVATQDSLAPSATSRRGSCTSPASTDARGIRTGYTTPASISATDRT